MTQMIDLKTATFVDIYYDNTGKLWVNVDEKCVLRVGQVEAVQYDDPIRGKDTTAIEDIEG